jgi:tetratricopeptide (TPR) repeat protein
MRTACKGFILGALVLLMAFGSAPLHARAKAIGATQNVKEDDFQFSIYCDRMEAAKSVVFQPGHTPEEYGAADLALTTILADRQFAQLSKVKQGEAYSGAGWAALRTSNYPRARDMFARATILDPDDSDNWIRLATLDDDLKDFDAAAIALTSFARKSPDRLDEQVDFIIQLANQAEKDSKPRLELLQTLFDLDWRPMPLGASDLWFDLALARIQLGQPEAARKVIERITWPGKLVQLRSDKRFDGLVDPTLPQFDVARAASRQVDEIRVQAILHPTKLQNAVELTYVMLADGMNEATLELTDEILAGIAASTDKPPFEDMGRQVWIMNNRSLALYRMGRIPEALEQLERASKVDEDGHANVSQVLNLGEFYCGLERGDDAMATAARTGSTVDDLHSMSQASLFHCAALLKGDKAIAAKAMEYLRKNRKDDQSAYLNALVRSNQLDEAARIVIELLASTTYRNPMLYDLQDFPDASTLPGDVAANARWKAILGRKDVREAVDRVGRTQHYDYFAKF